MAELKTFVIERPGHFGLNEIDVVASDQETDVPHGSVIENGIIENGKLRSRKDFNLHVSTSNQCYGVWAVTTRAYPPYEGLIVHELGQGTMLYYSSGTLSRITSANVFGTALTDMQVFNHGANVLVVGYGIIPIDYRRISGVWSNPSIVGGPSNPNCGTAAYARAWLANKTTLYWSKLNTPFDFSTGDSGSLAVDEVWPSEQTEIIVAIAIAFGRLFVLGRNNILVYDNVYEDPTVMYLSDTAEGLGCIARDSVVTTPKGIYFLSEDGLFFINRYATIANLMATSNQSERYSVSLRDAMNTCARDSEGRMRGVRAGFDERNGNYLLSFPSANVSFCVHAGAAEDQHGDPVTTKWTNAGEPFYGFAYGRDGKMYTSGSGGLYRYDSYTPDGTSNAYNLTYYSNWLDLGDESIVKMMKHMSLTLTAASGQSGTVYWLYNYEEGSSQSATVTCDATEFAENPGAGTVRVHMFGSGNVVKVGAEFPITGTEVVLDFLRLFYTDGRRKK